MGIGTSIVLFTVGAILRFATSATARGFNLQTIGLILMLVGGVGLLISFFYWNSWGGFGTGVSRSRTRTIVRGDGTVPSNTVVGHTETVYEDDRTLL